MGAGSAAEKLSRAACDGDLGTVARMMQAAKCSRAGTSRFYEADFQLIVADALGAAAAAGASDSVRLLLQCGAPPDGRSRSGATALMEAAAQGHVECIARLLAANADVNVTAGAGCLTAFHTACMAAQSDAALALLHARADATARGGEHIAMTGLEMAKSRGPDDATAVAVGKVLRGWSREEESKQLLRAAELGDLPTLEKMLWTGAWRTLEGGLHRLRNTHLPHKAICAAYLVVARQCHSHCLPLLLSSVGKSIEYRQSESASEPQPTADGADYKPLGWHMHYPLPPGVPSSTNKQVSGRVRPGVDILDAEGRTALMLATGGGEPEHDVQGAERRVRCIEWLLDAGAEVNPARDKFGRTVMHYACITGHASAAWALLRAGADVTALLNGQDCIALATAAGHRDMAADLSCQNWRVSGGANGEIELSSTDDEDSSSMGSVQPSSADEDEVTNDLLLLDRARSEPLYSWIKSSFAGGIREVDSAGETVRSQGSSHQRNDSRLKDSTASDLSWSHVVPRPASARARTSATVPSRPLYAQAAEDTSRYGSLPLGGKLAQRLAPQAAAATPALTAAERAMWEVQLHLDAVQKRSMERMRGPPPISLAHPEKPDKLIAPAFRRKQQHDDARTIESLAGWFDLHERTDMVSRKINTAIDQRFGLGECARSDVASAAVSETSRS